MKVCFDGNYLNLSEGNKFVLKDLTSQLPEVPATPEYQLNNIIRFITLSNEVHNCHKYISVLLT